MLQVARENLQLASELRAEKLAADAAVERIHVSVTSASSELGRHIVSMIASGDVFGPALEVSLTLCDTDAAALSAVDLASGSVDVTSQSDPTLFFPGADVVLLLDDIVGVAGERRADWLRRVHDRFSAHARHIDAVCRRDVVVVVPAINSAANFVGTVLSRCRPALNVVVVSRLVENIAVEAVSRRAGAAAGSVVDLVVWGDASAASPGRFALDASRGKVYDCGTSAVWGPHHCRGVESVVHDNKWLYHDLPVILSSSSASSAEVISMATALASFLSDWWTGDSSSQRLHSVAVASQGHTHFAFILSKLSDKTQL